MKEIIATIVALVGGELVLVVAIITAIDAVATRRRS